MSRLKFIFILLLLACGTAALVRLDFVRWKIIHPTAPNWAYLIDK